MPKDDYYYSNILIADSLSTFTHGSPDADIYDNLQSSLLNKINAFGH